ncbi:MAG: HAMP domain-containing sensor histidine kinase [Eubacterium sp.]|nr:HAMP domain-containing sensor histidine kinase [Eubacterium sp.]
MKHSIRLRLILIVSLMMIVAIGSIFAANIFLLPSFYQTTKVNQMSSVYKEARDICRDVEWDSLTAAETEQIYDQLDSLGGNRGVSMYIVRISASDNGSIAGIDFVYPTSTSRLKNVTVSQLAMYVRAMYFGEPLDDNCEQIKKNDQYAVYKVFDQRIGSNYIELTGQMPDGYWLYLRANYTGIRDNASVSNRFLIIVGIVVTVICIVLIFVLANRYTRPILRLARWAEEMRGLDFSSRYEVDRDDEIGVLAGSMNELSDKLESTISELKTANNELTHDIEKKAEQEQMRQEFLANISHELKTPIALIQGYAEGLKENINDDPESREYYCEVIVDEADKMNCMVKKLLSLNQIEFGNGQVHLEHFDINEMLAARTEASDILFRQKDVTLRYQPAEEPLMVWADEYMIEEVLGNYISNAVNHVEPQGEDGSCIIEIKALKNGDKVRISVFNTGQPIPEEDIDKIWDKFYKVDKARTREYGGNGIGLSIVKAVMEAHNQKYGVINYDNGVEFWFELDVS